MKTLQVVEQLAINMTEREDIANLVSHYDLKDFRYAEIQALQNLSTAIAAWPLLLETVQIAVLAHETPKLIDAS